MTIGNIGAGGTGQFGVLLLLNGGVYVPPADSDFVLSPTFTASDASVSFAPATADASNGSIPLASQVVVTVPAGDLGTSVTITATATAPDGSPVTASLSVALTPEQQVFTLSLSQLA